MYPNKKTGPKISKSKLGLNLTPKIFTQIIKMMISARANPINGLSALNGKPGMSILRSSISFGILNNYTLSMRQVDAFKIQISGILLRCFLHQSNLLDLLKVEIHKKLS